MPSYRSHKARNCSAFNDLVKGITPILCIPSEQAFNTCIFMYEELRRQLEIFQMQCHCFNILPRPSFLTVKASRSKCIGMSNSQKKESEHPTKFVPKRKRSKQTKLIGESNPQEEMNKSSIESLPGVKIHDDVEPMLKAYVRLERLPTVSTNYCPTSNEIKGTCKPECLDSDTCSLDDDAVGPCPKSKRIYIFDSSDSDEDDKTLRNNELASHLQSHGATAHLMETGFARKYEADGNQGLKPEIQEPDVNQEGDFEQFLNSGLASAHFDPQSSSSSMKFTNVPVLDGSVADDGLDAENNEGTINGNSTTHVNRSPEPAEDFMNSLEASSSASIENIFVFKTETGFVDTAHEKAKAESKMIARMDKSLQNPAIVHPKESSEQTDGGNLERVVVKVTKEITESEKVTESTKYEPLSSSVWLHEEFQSAVAPVEAIPKVKAPGDPALGRNRAEMTHINSSSTSEQSHGKRIKRCDPETSGRGKKRYKEAPHYSLRYERSSRREQRFHNEESPRARRSRVTSDLHRDDDRRCSESVRPKSQKLSLHDRLGHKDDGQMETRKSRRARFDDRPHIEEHRSFKENIRTERFRANESYSHSRHYGSSERTRTAPPRDRPTVEPSHFPRPALSRTSRS